MKRKGNFLSVWSCIVAANAFSALSTVAMLKPRAHNKARLPCLRCRKVSTRNFVEGITEYRLANGLRVLMFPDQTKQTIMSTHIPCGLSHRKLRRDRYGPLAGNTCLQRYPEHPNIPQELTAHGSVQTAVPGLTAPTISKPSATDEI